MSHEPTEDELTVAEIRYWHGENTGIKDALTAANSIRDGRIRAEALEEAAQSLRSIAVFYRQADRGVYATLLEDATEIIRALKDKTD